MWVTGEGMLKQELSWGLSNRVVKKAEETSAARHWTWLISAELKNPQWPSGRGILLPKSKKPQEKIILRNGNLWRITKVSMTESFTSKHLPVWIVWNRFKKSAMEVKLLSITLGCQKRARKLGGEIKKPALSLLPTEDFLHLKKA